MNLPDTLSQLALEIARIANERDQWKAQATELAAKLKEKNDAEASGEENAEEDQTAKEVEVPDDSDINEEG